jgi:hypothetical protein
MRLVLSEPTGQKDAGRGIHIAGHISHPVGDQDPLASPPLFPSVIPALKTTHLTLSTVQSTNVKMSE